MSYGLRRNIEPPAAHPAPRVLMATLPACPVDPGWSALERKRRLWWHNPRRHRWVADLDLALLKGDAVTLREAGIKLNRDELRRARRGGSVVILSEMARHALALQEFLPGWQVLRAFAGGDTNQHDRRVIDKDGEKTPPGKIITLMALHMAGGIETDVLVRATGGRDRLNLNGNASIGYEVEANAGLVIDFVDDSDEETAQDTAWRVQEYRQQRLQVMEPDLNT